MGFFKSPGTNTAFSFQEKANILSFSYQLDSAPLGWFASLKLAKWGVFCQRQSSQAALGNTGPYTR